jgi:hypothetical protein
VQDNQLNIAAKVHKDKMKTELVELINKLKDKMELLETIPKSNHILNLRAGKSFGELAL